MDSSGRCLTGVLLAMFTVFPLVKYDKDSDDDSKKEQRDKALSQRCLRA